MVISASARDFLALDLGLGTGFDRARAVYGSGYVPRYMLAADLDGNGRDDLVIGGPYESLLRVLTSVCK